MPKGFEWDQLEGTGFGGHLQLYKNIALLFGEKCQPRPSNWSYSNSFSIRIPNIPSFFNCSDMTSWLLEKRYVQQFLLLTQNAVFRKNEIEQFKTFSNFNQGNQKKEVWLLKKTPLARTLSKRVIFEWNFIFLSGHQITRNFLTQKWQEWLTIFGHLCLSNFQEKSEGKKFRSRQN